MLVALKRLGDSVPPGTEIVLGGGAALILGGYLDRTTGDGDVVHAEPRLSDLRAAIELVADELALGVRWLNDAVKAWADVLPPDFTTRIEAVATYGNLTVRRLGRLDLILMKFFAGRIEDLDDLEKLAPTVVEVAFVRSQLERIATRFPDKAHRMELYLDQGESLYGTSLEPEPAKPSPRRGRGRGV